MSLALVLLALGSVLAGYIGIPGALGGNNVLGNWLAPSFSARSATTLATGQVDLIAGDATAGLIKSLDLVQLEDTRHYFPPYDAVPVARASTLLRYPQVRTALERLAGRITAADMREMNYAADARRENPADVARRFLDRRPRD